MASKRKEPLGKPHRAMLYGVIALLSIAVFGLAITGRLGFGQTNLTQENYQEAGEIAEKDEKSARVVFMKECTDGGASVDYCSCVWDRLLEKYSFGEMFEIAANWGESQPEGYLEAIDECLKFL